MEFLFQNTGLAIGLLGAGLAACLAGAGSGIGTGIVFMFSATTGGTDMLAALLQRKMKDLSLICHAFQEQMQNRYMMAEEM